MTLFRKEDFESLRLGHVSTNEECTSIFLKRKGKKESTIRIYVEKNSIVIQDDDNPEKWEEMISKDVLLGELKKHNGILKKIDIENLKSRIIQVKPAHYGNRYMERKRCK